MRLRSAEVSRTASLLQAAGLTVVMLGAFAILALGMVHTGPSATAHAPGSGQPVAVP